MEAFTADGFHTGGWGRSKKLQTTSDQWTDCHYWVTHLTAASNEPKHRRVLGLMKIQPVWLHSLDYPSLRNTANNKQISQTKSCNKWLCRFLLRPHQQHSAITETETALSLVNHYQTPTLHIYRPNGGGDPTESKHHWKHLRFCPAGAVCKAAIIHPTIGCLSLTWALSVFAYKAETDWHGRKAGDLWSTYWFPYTVCMCVCAVHCDEWA